MVNLNIKEKMLLEDEKSHEELCVKKYQDGAQKAQDPELKALFEQLAQKEQQHLNSINQILSGTVPNVNQSQGQQSQQSQQQNMVTSMNLESQPMINVANMNQTQTMSYNDHDKILCQDALSTEKFVSSTYNTAIFEFRDKSIRQVLNHIQKEEQEHGEKIYNYMAQHGMYNA